MLINDIYRLDQEYRQLRADFILGKIAAVEFTRLTREELKPVPALLKTPEEKPHTVSRRTKRD